MRKYRGMTIMCGDWVNGQASPRANNGDILKAQ